VRVRRDVPSPRLDLGTPLGDELVARVLALTLHLPGGVERRQAFGHRTPQSELAGRNMGGQSDGQGEMTYGVPYSVPPLRHSHPTARRGLRFIRRQLNLLRKERPAHGTPAVWLADPKRDFPVIKDYPPKIKRGSTVTSLRNTHASIFTQPLRAEYDIQCAKCVRRFSNG